MMMSFDEYCRERQITIEEAPAAFAAYLNHINGWDGQMERVDDGTE